MTDSTLPENTAPETKTADADSKTKNTMLSLSEAGQHDFRLGLKAKKTGWGIVSADRAARGVSRQARIRAKNG